jgi:hypothetical protein
MPTFSHPSAPMLVHDQATYMRQMHEWHHMAKYHEEKLYHLEMAKHFHHIMGRRVKELPVLVTT